MAQDYGEERQAGRWFDEILQWYFTSSIPTGWWRSRWWYGMPWPMDDADYSEPALEGLHWCTSDPLLSPRLWHGATAFSLHRDVVCKTHPLMHGRLLGGLRPRLHVCVMVCKGQKACVEPSCTYIQ